MVVGLLLDGDGEVGGGGRGEETPGGAEREALGVGVGGAEKKVKVLLRNVAFCRRCSDRDVRYDYFLLTKTAVGQSIQQTASIHDFLCHFLVTHCWFAHW